MDRGTGLIALNEESVIFQVKLFDPLILITVFQRATGRAEAVFDDGNFIPKRVVHAKF